METKECTALFLDIRNFTEQFGNDSKKLAFLKLIKDVYQCGIDTTISILKNNNFYINSTGDGFLLIIFGENHFIKAFNIALQLYKQLTPLFVAFNGEKYIEGEYGFGIGIESGMVYEILATTNGKEIKTYLGDVINIAARLESLSKEHARAPIIYGPEINQLLISCLYKKDYKQLMYKAKHETNPKEVKKLHSEMNKLNSKLLSSYMFEHKLKGVKKHIPVFRISPSLLENTDGNFERLFNELQKELK